MGALPFVVLGRIFIFPYVARTSDIFGGVPQIPFFVTIRKRMGIEPTQDSLHYPAPDLKSGSPTSELGASTGNVLDQVLLGKPFLRVVREQRTSRRAKAHEINSQSFISS